MTDRTVSEIRDDIIDLIMLQLARDGRIAISPGSNATRWQTKAKVKQKLAQMEGGE